MNSTVKNLTFHGGFTLPNERQFSISEIFLWLFSRLRIFLYLSSPYEESFEFEHQVADYHTEVSYYLLVISLLIMIYKFPTSISFHGTMTTYVLLVYNMLSICLE